MSELQKVYSLPDLPPAPTSDLQALVRRLIEYADFSTLPAICDELQQQNRIKDYTNFRKWVVSEADSLSQHPSNRLYWTSIPYPLRRIFWLDLFSLEGLAQFMTERLSTEPEKYEGEGPEDTYSRQSGLVMSVDDGIFELGLDMDHLRQELGLPPVDPAATNTQRNGVV